MTPIEQEGVVLTLLGMQTDLTFAGITVDPEERPEVLSGTLGEPASLPASDVTRRASMPAEAGATTIGSAPVEPGATAIVSMPVDSGATELIPKPVEDLRGLTGLANADEDIVQEAPAWHGSTTYRARWIHRWKASALTSAAAVTMLFALTGDVSSYGPMEWFVAIFATVVGGGLMVGTLVNFAVAAIRAPEPRSNS
jgi:hypothetical protein